MGGSKVGCCKEWKGVGACRKNMGEGWMGCMGGSSGRKRGFKVVKVKDVTV